MFGFESSIELLKALLSLISNIAIKDGGSAGSYLLSGCRRDFPKNHLPLGRKVQPPEWHRRETAAAAAASHHNPCCPGGWRQPKGGPLRTHGCSTGSVSLRMQHVKEAGCCVTGDIALMR